MKIQFSIAGVMVLTLIISLGLWSLLYANFLFAHVATTSILAGGVVGWIVGACYGQSERGCIAGVLGALPWTCAAALADLQAWSRAHRFVAWGGLAVVAALGAVPMASTVAVYERSRKELIVRPMISCVVAVAIAGLAATIGLVIIFFLNPPSYRWGDMMFAANFILTLVFSVVAACIGVGYGVMALALRSLEREGRKYRDAHPPKFIQPDTVAGHNVTAEHTDPAPADHQ